MNSPRLILRLEIARRLEHLPAGADMRLHIKMLNPARREHLRALVDWVQEYETYQQKFDSALAFTIKAGQAKKQKLLQPLRSAHGR